MNVQHLVVLLFVSEYRGVPAKVQQVAELLPQPMATRY